MKSTVKVALRMSEVRQRLNEIADTDEMSDVLRTEADTLGNEYRDLEVRHRAALLADSGETVTEGDPARVELEGRASLSGILSGIMSGTGTSGPERELQDELGLTGDQVPLALLGTKTETEYRTAGQSSAPSTVGADQRPIVAAVFPRSATAFLGVRMPTVPVGDSVHTVLTTNLAPGVPAGGAAQAHSAGAFTATKLDPHRIQGSFFIRREQRASLAGMEQALRMNLSDSMASKMDAEVLAGSEGFFGSGLTNPTNPSTEATFATYRGLVYDSAVIDGLYAYSASDVRVLLGAATYAHAATKYRSNNADDSALDSLMRVSGGVQVSSHVPAAASNDQGLLIAKDVGREHAVAPIWEGVQVIVDEVTQAAEGEIVFTAVMLWGRLAVLRSAAFARKEVQLA